MIEGNYTFNLDTSIKEKLATATSADKASLKNAQAIQDKLNSLEDQMISGEIDYDTYESKLAVLEQELIKAEESYEEEKKAPKTQENKQKTKDTELKEASADGKFKSTITLCDPFSQIAIYPPRV